VRPTHALREASPNKEANVHAYELRIRGLDDNAGVAAARWQLLACPEVRDLVRKAGTDRFLVLYAGKWEQPKIWCRVLANAGYTAEPIGGVDETKQAS
jgi:hypothetical protein